MPGGIDPHTHLEMPFMGTTAAETWESGTFAALSGGTTTVVDFVIPGPGGMIAGAGRLGAACAPTGLVRLFISHVRHRLVAAAFRRDGARWSTRGINTFKHFMAYKGALMVE